MKTFPIYIFLIVISVLVIIPTNAIMTQKQLQKKVNSCVGDVCTQNMVKQSLQLNVTTQCNQVDLSAEYNYTGIVRSGYLSVGFGGSALSFIFYGKSDIKDASQLKNIPTIIWLNGGPGHSSQIGNLIQIGPLLLKRKLNVEVVMNDNSWVKKYNVLFVDQPVGTGLSYADLTSSRPFATSLDDVANDFYYALNQLYNTMDGCFNSRNLDIPATAPLFIVGQGYGGKYAPAIAKKIVQQQTNSNGFLTGLKGVAIGNAFTSPYEILSEVGNYAFHLSLLDYQERMKVETILLRSAKNNGKQDYLALHNDFHSALDYIVQQAGHVNVYDIRIDGDYEQYLRPYFRDPHNIKLYGLNSGIIFDSTSDEVYNKLKSEFMKSQTSRVEYLLNKKVPVLVFQSQHNLMVQNPGAMKWVDRLRYENSQQFRKSLFKGWKLNDKIVGSVKSAGLLQLRIVNNAGHWAPMDAPEASLDMASTFVEKNK